MKVIVIPNNDHGDFNLDAFKDAINVRTKIIMITHISSSGGRILPIAEIVKTASKNNILYLVDACQSFGQIPRM